MNNATQLNNPSIDPPVDVLSAPLPADYPAWAASQKQGYLWQERILRSRYGQLPPLRKIDVIGLFLTALRAKMDRLSDQAPPGWRKAIHAHASVAKIAYIALNSPPFTGLFKGGDYGLLRLSVTGDPKDRGFAPGLAIKFFVDGQPSVDVSALVSLTGQGKNYNFFANEFSNIVPVVNEFGPKFINLIFSRVTRYPTKLDLKALALFDQQGQAEPNPQYPEQVFLVPNPALQFPETPDHDFREDLATIPAGTTLFSVYAALPNPNPTPVTDAEGQTRRQQAQQIGEIKTTSEFVASAYGDSQLFFRHQRFRNQ
jgi:hypothetical protein